MNRQVFEGHFGMYWMTESDKCPYLVACLSKPGTRVDATLIELFEPVLIGAGNGKFQLRGFERADEAAVAQEWICEVTAR